MSGKKRSNVHVVALLERYHCPLPLHAVRARFMGSIASPIYRSPIHVIQGLWGGELPAVDTIADLNHLLQVLVAGVWQELTAHQAQNNPFKLTSLRLTPTREGLRQYASVRKQEIEGFVDGLFGAQDAMDLPESAHLAVQVLGEIRAMLTGAITLLEDAGMPAGPADRKGLSDNLRALATIIGKEINTIVFACTRARSETLRDPPTPIVQ